MVAHPFLWDDKRVAALREMRAEGLTASAIGQRFGVSRSAVLGKLHRLKVVAPPRPTRPAPVPKPEATRPAPKPKPVVPTVRGWPMPAGPNATATPASAGCRSGAMLPARGCSAASL